MVSGMAEPPAAAVYPAGLPWGIFTLLPKKACEWVLWAFDATAFGTFTAFVCIATSVLEGTPAGRCTQRAVLAFGSYCATDRTAWNFPCPPLPLQDHRGSPVLELLLPAQGWTPWCWGAITILWWTFLKHKIQPHEFEVFLLLIGSSFGCFPSKKQVFSQSLKIYISDSTN